MRRYAKDKIYTSIGPVLIAVNPYKLIQTHYKGDPAGLKKSIYDPLAIKAHMGKQIHELAPHPFAVAEDAYRHLGEFKQNQSIIITGESGAGKTETAKQIMNYIAEVSVEGARAFQKKGGKATKTRRKTVQESERVREQLLGSNPCLEAMGNAQTLRNYNSSRFGKYMVLQFNFLHEVTGGSVTNYLLEKSRVVGQTDGERNFHLFYQLMKGASAEEQAKWRVSPELAKGFNLVQKKSDAPPTINDVEDYKEMRESLTVVGIELEKQEAMMKSMAAILHAGNIRFEGGENATVTADTAADLAAAAELFGIDKDLFTNGLTQRTVSVGGARSSIHVKPLEAHEAQVTVESTCKAVYSKTFDWLVEMVNFAVNDTNGKRNSTMGILDIYGFEIFENNSFEQLCINYVNEKLQQVFIELTLKSEQDEYAAEGIKWTPVEFFNNKVVCDLIEGKPSGVLNMLDEQCMLAEPSDESLLEKINQQHGEHAQYTKSRFSGKSQQGEWSGAFGIVHYAGNVDYNVVAFVDKNKDTLFEDVSSMFRASSEKFLVRLFEDKRKEADRKKRPPTTAMMFKQQVQTLMAELTACNPHYIRCIKPNDVKKPKVYEKERCEHQVRYLGLVENIRIRRAGYVYRQPAEKFLARYKMLSASVWPSLGGMTPQKAADALLGDKENVHININGVRTMFEKKEEGLGAYQLGKTKVFIRQPKALFALENLRAAKLPWVAGIIQRAIKKCLMRMKLTKMCDLVNAINMHHVAYGEHMTERTSRVDPATRAATPAMAAQWQDYQKVLPAGSHVNKSVTAQEQAMHASFVQSHARAVTGRIKFSKEKKAALAFQAAFLGLRHRRLMPADQYEICHNAVLSLRSVWERYMGQKQRRRASFEAEKKRDYIEGGAAAQAPVVALMGKHGQKAVQFAAKVMKINVGKLRQERICLVTDDIVFNTDHKFSEKRHFNIVDIKAVKMSLLPDSFLVFKLADDNHDMAIICEQKTELVNILRTAFERLTKKKLTVEFSNSIDVHEKTSLMQSIDTHHFQFVALPPKAPLAVGDKVETRVAGEIKNGILKKEAGGKWEMTLDDGAGAHSADAAACKKITNYYKDTSAKGTIIVEVADASVNSRKGNKRLSVAVGAHAKK